MSSTAWLGTAGELPLHAYNSGYKNLSILGLDSAGIYQWHTFYGDGQDYNDQGIAVDANGNLYFVAPSRTTWLGEDDTPPLHPYQGDGDISVLKLGPQSPVIVTKTGSGGGTVTSQPPGIDCGADCREVFPTAGEVMTLTAAADVNSVFHGWSGVCSGSSECVVASPERVIATFDAFTYTLSVSLDGTGGGTVTSSPAGIDCGAICSAGFVRQSMVTLSASPDANSVFTGWNGACSGSGDCVVVMTGTLEVTATFDILTYALQVIPNGTGRGTVTSNPSDINCQPDGTGCSAEFAPGTSVVLTAQAQPGSVFSGWSGACYGIHICILSMQGPRLVTATFTLEAASLQVSLAGSGSGTVTSSPPGIDCGSAGGSGGTDCSEFYDLGEIVTLTAQPAPGSTFDGWTASGGSPTCSGSGECSITMSGTQQVTATFTLEQHILSLALAGNGSGTVTSSPPGIDCGSAGGSTDCSETFDYGTVVTLTAQPAPGSSFDGWTTTGGSPACSGSGVCSLTMIEAKDVTATFSLNTYELSVALSGTGSGMVTSSPPGIACAPSPAPADCSELFAYGTPVTLTAQAAQGSVFEGWSGACSGAGACVVTISEARQVSASFRAGSQPEAHSLFLPLVNKTDSAGRSSQSHLPSERAADLKKQGMEIRV